MATMKAAQVTEKGKDFDIVEREIPEPGEGQVRVKVEACGICHGDAVAKFGSFNSAWHNYNSHQAKSAMLKPYLCGRGYLLVPTIRPLIA